MGEGNPNRVNDGAERPVAFASRPIDRHRLWLPSCPPSIRMRGHCNRMGIPFYAKPNTAWLRSLKLGTSITAPEPSSADAALSNGVTRGESVRGNWFHQERDPKAPPGVFGRKRCQRRTNVYVGAKEVPKDQPLPAECSSWFRPVTPPPMLNKCGLTLKQLVAKGM